MLQDVEYTVLQKGPDTEVTGVVCHSKKAAPGMVFVCIEGEAADGHIFAKEAVKMGCAVIVCSKPLSFQEPVTVIQTKDTRRALAKIAAAYYEYPARQLRLIGVTGTKGKTTVTYMLQSIFQQAGIPCGRLGTVENDTVARQYPSSQTTPDPLELHRLLREMVDGGCQFAVIEVSSQAMMHHRLDGISFDLGILTNISEDHIGPGEHKSFEEYVFWKSQMFHQCKRAIVNLDTPCTEQIMEDYSQAFLFTYSMKRCADLWADAYEFIRLPGKLAVEFQTKGRYNIKLVTGSPGLFSVANSLAAVAAAKYFDIENRFIQKALREVTIPGRQELFALDYTRTILIDYAHNGASLEALLLALREYAPRYLTCVFGCGGERDPARRKNMGKVAAKYADFSIITADNPRSESLDLIICDIIKGLDVFSGNYQIIRDRKDAIDYAVRNCRDGEIVVIAGKGHERIQLLNEGAIAFDDREVVRETIEKVKYEQNYSRRNQDGDQWTIAFRR